MSAHSTWTFIEKSSELEKALRRIDASPWIGFDLEADSLHSYPERVCLIQIGCSGGEYLLDTLALEDLRPLFRCLQKRELIIHGCDYDLRLLAKSFNFRPSQVFDTKEAARLVGMRQFGLSALTTELLGVELEKSGQKADWSQRPLKESLLEYARNDVIHLNDLKKLLTKRLKKLGRLGWHEETSRHILEVYSNVEEPDPELRWRIKGSHKLNRLGLSILQHMWEWREEEAVRLNRPPFFVLPHRKMIEIADAASNKEPYMEHIPKKYPSRRRSGVLAAIQEGLKTRVADRPRKNPSNSRRPRLPRGEKFYTYEELKGARDMAAEVLDLDPTVIASRSELESLASNWHDGLLQLMPWQSGVLLDHIKENKHDASMHDAEI